jgi:Peptidase inhibitor family I36
MPVHDQAFNAQERIIMRGFRWLTLPVVTACMVAMSMFVGTQSASAAYNCNAGNFCLYEHIRFGGGQAQFGGSTADYSRYTFKNGNQLINRASSVWNAGFTDQPSYVRLYIQKNYVGGGLCLRANTGFDWLGNYGTGGVSYNDNVESHRWVSSC